MIRGTRYDPYFARDPQTVSWMECSHTQKHFYFCWIANTRQPNANIDDDDIASGGTRKKERD